ncbi:MAG: DNA repair protein RecO [Proteobacteria bacterium]|nr:DNA repair protein RecO [Pseudomonadota bacterium]MBU1716945.1 DNA repair protein RecO [Pseudomonadota bacterium]
MPPLHLTPAVVINVQDHGESDKIVTFYCPHVGKMAGIAKGAKRSKKRFVNKLEIFSLLEIEYTESKHSSLVRVDQAELLDPFVFLRENYKQYVAATLFCELVIFWTRENDPDPEIFRLLTWALAKLNAKDHTPEITVLFLLKFLDLLGYRPQLAGCVSCGVVLDVKHGPYCFSLGRNGIICKTCNQDHQPTTIPLAINTAKILNKAQDMPLEKISRLQFARQSLLEAINLLKKYSDSLLHRDIHSWKPFLQSL